MKNHSKCKLNREEQDVDFEKKLEDRNLASFVFGPPLYSVINRQAYLSHWKRSGEEIRYIDEKTSTDVL